MEAITQKQLDESATVFECLQRAIVEMMTPETDYDALLEIIGKLSKIADEHNGQVSMELGLELTDRRVTFTGLLKVESP